MMGAGKVLPSVPLTKSTFNPSIFHLSPLQHNTLPTPITTSNMVFGGYLPHKI